LDDEFSADASFAGVFGLNLAIKYPLSDETFSGVVFVSLAASAFR
jgi:hypothetical protein